MEEKNKVGIGKEVEPLKPHVVKIVDAVIGMQKDKDGREVGEKVSLFCKHPDREQPINISKVEYRKGKLLKTSGLWFKLDDEGFLPFGSALSNLLRHLKAENVEDLKDKNVETTTDEEGYLVAKAY